MIEREKEIKPCFALILLLAVFAFSYPLWHLNDRELRFSEGVFATAVTETQGFPLAFTVHGCPYPQASPLYLLLSKVIYTCGNQLLAPYGFNLSMEFSLRFVSILCYFLLTLCVFFVCRRDFAKQTEQNEEQRFPRKVGPYAALAVMVSSMFVFEKLPEGYPESLTALLIFVGWCIWRSIEHLPEKWYISWSVIALFSTLIFYNAGFAGLVYFLVPLLFSGRHLRLIRNLNWKKTALIAVPVILVFSLRNLPYSNTENLLFSDSVSDFTFSEYFKSLLKFPFNLLLRFFPWSLFLWAPFCIALIPLEKGHISRLGQFHRSIFGVLLALIWLNPDNDVRHLFYLIPVVAVLIGMYYQTVVRRYEQLIRKVLIITGVVLGISAILTILYVTLPPKLYLISIPDFAHGVLKYVLSQSAAEQLQAKLHSYFDLNLLLSMRADCSYVVETSLSVLLIFFAFLLIRKRQPILLSIALLFAAFCTVMWVIHSPQYRYNAEERHSTKFGSKLREVLEKNKLKHKDVVYTNEADSLFAEGFYSGYPMRYIDFDAADNKKDDYGKDDLFLVSRINPSGLHRVWTRVAAIPYRLHNPDNSEWLVIYRGQYQYDEDEEE